MTNTLAFRIAGALALVAVSCASPSSADRQSYEAMEIELPAATSFVTTEGESVTTKAGRYRVLRTSDTSILVARHGSTAPTELRVHVTSHADKISWPIASVRRSGAEGSWHFLVDLPGGKRLDAPGSPAGVRSRGDSWGSTRPLSDGEEPSTAGISFRIVSPTLSATYDRGSALPVRWESSVPGQGELSIEIWRSDPVRVLVQRTANDGSFIWSIPADFPTGSYQVALLSTDGVYQLMSPTFRIRQREETQPEPPPDTGPNDSAWGSVALASTLDSGTRTVITWENELGAFHDWVRLRFNGSLICARTENDNRYVWPIDEKWSGTGRVEIEWLGGVSSKAQSAEASITRKGGLPKPGVFIESVDVHKHSWPYDDGVEPGARVTVAWSYSSERTETDWETLRFYLVANNNLDKYVCALPLDTGGKDRASGTVSFYVPGYLAGRSYRVAVEGDSSRHKHVSETEFAIVD